MLSLEFVTGNKWFVKNKNKTASGAIPSITSSLVRTKLKKITLLMTDNLYVVTWPSNVTTCNQINGFQIHQGRYLRYILTEPILFLIGKCSLPIVPLAILLHLFLTYLYHLHLVWTIFFMNLCCCSYHLAGPMFVKASTLAQVVLHECFMYWKINDLFVGFRQKLAGWHELAALQDGLSGNWPFSW